MEKNNLINYYQSEELSLDFDQSRQGYWLSLETNQNYFIEQNAFDEIKNLSGVDLFNKLNIYDSRIIFSLSLNRVPLSKLESAIKIVAEKEATELAEFIKARSE